MGGNSGWNTRLVNIVKEIMGFFFELKTREREPKRKHGNRLVLLFHHIKSHSIYFCKYHKKPSNSFSIGRFLTHMTPSLTATRSSDSCMVKKN